MKAKLLTLTTTVMVAFTACDKDGHSNSANSSTANFWETFINPPALESVDDVCTKMNDAVLAKWCYENYDINNDGKVSMSEAKMVKTFEVPDNVEDMKGIEYFANIEKLKFEGRIYTNSLHLEYNTKMSYLSGKITDSCEFYINSEAEFNVRFYDQSSSIDIYSLSIPSFYISIVYGFHPANINIYTTRKKSYAFTERYDGTYERDALDYDQLGQIGVWQIPAKADSGPADSHVLLHLFGI